MSQILSPVQQHKRWLIGIRRSCDDLCQIYSVFSCCLAGSLNDISIYVTLWNENYRIFKQCIENADVTFFYFCTWSYEVLHTKKMIKQQNLVSSTVYVFLNRCKSMKCCLIIHSLAIKTNIQRFYQNISLSIYIFHLYLTNLVFLVTMLHLNRIANFQKEDVW